MASRRDQLHSYQFMMQRVISSIMLHETDPEHTPLRRGVGAVFGGVMLAGLLAIVFGVYGVVSGNYGTRWQKEGVIVIERETGAHFVYQGDVLQPVLNYASARLLADAADVQRVPSRNLAGISRTVPVGIPGAPDSLPPADRALGPPWTMCSAPGRDPAGSPITTTLMLIGEPAVGGDSLADYAVFVREDSEDSTHYLLWRGHRYRIVGDDPLAVIRSLYGFQAQVIGVGTAWLNSLPAGQDLGPIPIDGMGDESEAVTGRKVGEVLFHPVAGGQQYYLVLDNGLAHLTELQMLLVRGDYAVEPAEISAAEANDAPASDALAVPAADAAPPAAPPELMPLAAAETAPLCAETTDASSAPRLSFGADLTVATAAVPTIVESPEGVRLADWVLVPPGHLAVVRAVASDRTEIGAYHLVTDLGLRFPVPSAEVLASLGYSPEQAVDMPAALVQRIPAGPTLDPIAARLPAGAVSASAAG